MNCNLLHFDCAEMMNILISSIIGIGLAYFTAWSYERFMHERKMQKLWNDFQFLESKNEEFDWKQWNLQNGQISNAPINSFMRMKYLDAAEFEFEWIESVGGNIEGVGRLIFDNKIKGILYFFSVNAINYKYRNVFYRVVEHMGEKYDAIFVDAADEGKKYVMMRKK
jgi:hypothetical protein